MPSGQKNKYGLTEKQEAFAKEVVLNGGDQTKAYRKVYDTKTKRDETVYVAASELAGDPKVARRIYQLKQAKEEKLQKEHDTSIEALRKLYSQWLYSDITEFMEMSLEEVKALPKDIRLLITGFDKSEKTIRNAEGNKETETTYRFKFIDKHKAAEMLNKHRGFYEKDNQQKDIKVNITRKIIDSRGD